MEKELSIIKNVKTRQGEREREGGRETGKV